MRKKKIETVPPYKKYFYPAASSKIQRNAPCPCGSGKKYKKCCLKLN